MKVLFISLMLLAYSQVQAQTATGVIRGVITTDSSGSPIANVTIALTHTSFVTQTDKNGVYRLTGIPPGIYQLKITAPGYSGWLFDEVVVAENIPLVFSLKLKGDPHILNTFRLRPPPTIPQLKEDRILIYQPDSTIDFKLRIVNPEARKKWSSPIPVPDSSGKHN